MINSVSLSEDAQLQATHLHSYKFVYNNCIIASWDGQLKVI